MNSIVLRPWQKQDAQELASLANNRNVSNNLRDTFPSPYTVMDALQWISHVNNQNPPIQFAIVCNGKLVGSIGCTTKEDISRKTIEIGYFVGEPYWGKGIASAAVKELLNFIDTKLSVRRIEANVFAANKASMKVLQKNGFYLESIQRKAVYKNNEMMDNYMWVKIS